MKRIESYGWCPHNVAHWHTDSKGWGVWHELWSDGKLQHVDTVTMGWTWNSYRNRDDIQQVTMHMQNMIAAVCLTPQVWGTPIITRVLSTAIIKKKKKFEQLFWMAKLWSNMQVKFTTCNCPVLRSWQSHHHQFPHYTVLLLFLHTARKTKETCCLQDPNTICTENTIL